MNMKKNNILLFLLMALPTLLLTSCLKDQEDLFPESASERTTKYLENAQKVLTSSENGWVLNYYPDRDLSYGGYVYTLKFDQDNVEVFSEISSEDVPSIKSTYQLKNEDGPVLTFDTYNEYMHLFATPHGSSGAGGYEAYDGDFIFIVMNISEDQNTITLKGNRSGNIMYMHRLVGEETAESYMNKIKNIKKEMIFKNYEIVFNTDTVTAIYQRSVQKSGGKFTFTYMEDGEVVNASTPVILTLDGITFKDTLNILGHEITGLKYVAGATEDIPAINDQSILFNPIVLPLSQQFLTGEWYIAYSKLGSYAQRYWNTVKAALEGIGEEMYKAYLADEKGFGFHFISYDGKTQYAGSLFFNSTVISNDEITLQFAMSGAGNGVWYHNNASFAYALFPFGYSSPRTFKLTTDNIAEPSIIVLTEEGNPSNVITLSAEEVRWPFDN
jgi:hypothetical protein